MKKRETYFKEQYRPGFHYSEESHIINDPNGLFYYDGEYHLMHQYNINNHIHWGHAVSNDLVHWKHLPAALLPDSIGQIWSGSAVVDWNNTSGLQCGTEKVIVALFTYNEHVDSQQSQGLAYSNDRGRTWKKYEQNPVLTSKGKADFRDPKVFWYAESNCWIMVLACGDHVEFYSSPNLIDWKFEGDFGAVSGSHQGVWECPDLFRLPVENHPDKSRWILLVSVNNGAPAGGTGMQYFMGFFDGKKFLNDNSDETILWLDYGKDFYAGVTWNDIPSSDGRRLMIAWADNWIYRDKLPTTPFKGQFSSVRELKLLEEQGKMHLIQQPIKEMQHLRKEKQTLVGDIVKSKWKLPVKSEMFELECKLELERDNEIVEFLLEETDGYYLKLVYNVVEEFMCFDRTHCKELNIEGFKGAFRAPLKIKNNILEVHLLVDRSQIEVFTDEGSVVMTNLFFTSGCKYISIQSQASTVKLIQADYYELVSIWEDKKDSCEQLDNILSGDWAQTIYGLEGDCEQEGILVCSQTYSDFVLEAKIKITSLRSGEIAGFVFGINEAKQGYKLLFDVRENEIKLLYKSKVLYRVECSLNVGRTYCIYIQMKEGILEIFCDGVLILQKDLKEYTDGMVGTCISNSIALFNNIKIQS